MMEWTSGRHLKTLRSDFKNANPAYKRNLSLLPDKETQSIRLIGHGKVIALGFLTNHINVVFGVQVDEEPIDWLYNPSCLDAGRWHPTQQHAPVTVYVNQVRGRRQYIINCFLPFIFYHHFQLLFLYQTFRQAPQRNVQADRIQVLYQTPIEPSRR